MFRNTLFTKRRIPRLAWKTPLYNHNAMLKLIMLKWNTIGQYRFPKADMFGACFNIKNLHQVFVYLDTQNVQAAEWRWNDTKVLAESVRNQTKTLKTNVDLHKCYHGNKRNHVKIQIQRSPESKKQYKRQTKAKQVQRKMKHYLRHSVKRYILSPVEKEVSHGAGQVEQEEEPLPTLRSQDIFSIMSMLTSQTRTLAGV